MIGLDTNILLRYILEDDEYQFKRVTELIETLTPEKQGYVSLVVLSEFFWVLKTGYKKAKSEMIESIKLILSLSVFQIEDYDVAYKALKLYETNKADFPDYIILTKSLKAGCKSVMTFDKAALLSKGFKSP